MFIHRKLKRQYGKVCWQFYCDVKYWILSPLFFLYRIMRYKNSYFFDTNFLIVEKKTSLDKRFFKLPILKGKYYITESVFQEYSALLESGRYKKRAPYSFHVLGFNDLYVTNPALCPVYYNFISCMHNPATVLSDSFDVELVGSKIIKGYSSKQVNIWNNKVMDRIIKYLNSETHLHYGKKTAFMKKLDSIHLAGIRKKRKSIRQNDPNHFNDIRSLSLALSFALTFEQNVNFVTSDQDLVYYFFQWSAATTQQIIFTDITLNTLKTEGIIDLMNEKKVPIFIPIKTLLKKMENIGADKFSDAWQLSAPKFSIFYWDQGEQKYYKIKLTLGPELRELLSHCHGSYSCVYSANATHGCFIGYRYWWPPNSRHNKDFIKILPLKKKIINETSYGVPLRAHEMFCEYRKLDRLNDVRNFSQFSR